MLSQSKYFGSKYYDHQDQKEIIGVSSMKIFDGEDLSNKKALIFSRGKQKED